ncbi:MAG: hypothetical protein DHS20C07_10920 [Methyloligella sp.]|nr:MAG: hypothetical protein DHS20C07_10920 [Methyloligella sp.]
MAMKHKIAFALTLPLLLSTTPSLADDIKALTPKGMEWTKEYKMSPGLKVGNTVYLSGNTAQPTNQSKEALKAAYVTMFNNVEKVLNEAGLSWADVIDMTSFHTDLEGQKEIFLKVRSKYLQKEPYPTWTAIDVDRLWEKEFVTEIKIVARVKN